MAPHPTGGSLLAHPVWAGIGVLVALLLGFMVVSSGFRGLAPIMFGIIANDDQVKDHQAAEVIGKSANFIGFGAKLAEEAFQEVG